MALPFIPLALRAGAALAKNKKAREALTKSVGGFLKRRQNLSQSLRRGKKEPPSFDPLTTFATGTAFGAGGKTIIEANRDKKTNTRKPSRFVESAPKPPSRIGRPTRFRAANSKKNRK
tara:strand:+ start:32 stop:385 length:354 start_codon:yes stop_codon:yes gene_type:complete